MAISLESRAEVIKLAKLLGEKPQALEHLHALPAEALMQLREGLAERFFGGHRSLFQRIANASRLVPNAINAMVAQKVFGPVLSARIAGEMSPKTAVDMAARMPLPFMCDLALELDPKRARDIIRAMPVETSVAIAVEMQRRREYVIMGRFVDYMTDATIRACVAAFKDESVLIEIGKFMEAKARIKDVLRMLSPERQRKLLLAAAASEQLLQDTESLMPYLDADLKKDLRKLVSDQDPKLVARLV